MVLKVGDPFEELQAILTEYSLMDLHEKKVKLVHIIEVTNQIITRLFHMYEEPKEITD